MRIKELMTILIFTLSLSYGCSEKIKPGELEVNRPEVTGVAIEEVRLVDITDYYETSGTVRATNTSFVSARIMGEVTHIRVNTGDRVQKGDLLLSVYSPEIESRLEAAREALAEAGKSRKIAEKNKDLMDKTFERFSILHEERAVTEQEFDEISAKKEISNIEYQRSLNSLKRAEAALKEAEAFQNHTVITSPVNGVVAEKRIDIGSMTIPGSPLFVIEGPYFRVEAPVDESMLSLVKTGMPVRIYIDAIALNTEGTIKEIVHQIDPRSRTFTVKIGIDEKHQSLRGGSYAKVKFPLGQKPGLFIQGNSVVSRGELKGVYVVDMDNIIKLRLVKTGKDKEGMTEILSGLQQGERIIVKGIDRAVDGGVLKYSEQPEGSYN